MEVAERLQLEDDLKTIARLKVKAWKLNDPVAMFMICAREKEIKSLLGVRREQK